MNKITKIVKRRETLKKISLLLLTVFIIFVIAETLCILFYDESVNYDEIVREEVKRFALRGNEIEKKVYADPDTGMFYRVDDKQLDKERYMRFDPLSVSEHAENETYRIAILGDSFARCGGLTNDDCDKYGLHVQLQNTLNKHVTVNDVNKFEVLSFADGGLNTYQEFLIFRDVVLSYSPDMVILQYTDNDIGPPRSELGWGRTGIYIYSRTNVLLFGDRIVPALPFIDESVSWVLLKNSAFFRFISYNVNIIMLKGSEIEDAEKSFESVENIYDLTKESNMQLIIINLPPANMELWNEKTQQHLKELSYDLGVPFYNMADHVDDISEIASDIEHDFPYHYNAEGYSIAAEVLKDAVLKEISLNS